MKKYTTIIMTLDRKGRISEAKKSFMLNEDLEKLSDSAYIVKLIEFYEANK